MSWHLISIALLFLLSFLTELPNHSVLFDAYMYPVVQAKLYRAFSHYKKQPGVKNNFFDQYQKLRPINVSIKTALSTL